MPLANGQDDLQLLDVLERPLSLGVTVDAVVNWGNAIEVVSCKRRIVRSPSDDSDDDGGDDGPAQQMAPWRRSALADLNAAVGEGLARG